MTWVQEIETMTRFKMWDEGAEQIIEAEDWDEARCEAADWLADAWEPGEETYWPCCHLAEVDDDGEVVCQERVTITVHPVEPDCIDRDEHQWASRFDLVGGIKENPGVWGHGGGVVIHEVCLRCGTERVTDTWAQNPATGEHGLESVRYEANKYADQVASHND